MMHITNLWAFQPVQMIEKSFPVAGLQFEGFFIIAAFIIITGIWSIKAFQIFNKDVATGLFEIKNVEISMRKLSFSFSLLSSSLSLFCFFYHIGYFQNYGQTNAKTASISGAFNNICSALSRLDVFRHAILFFKNPVCWSFVSLRHPERFNRLNSFVTEKSNSYILSCTPLFNCNY
ncbi:MAG: hypothetical protein JST26_01410 [Bacteroidetes bacterium]|nr:hypothetical protein [Bacteroidota bacterium]